MKQKQRVIVEGVHFRCVPTESEGHQCNHFRVY